MTRSRIKENEALPGIAEVRLLNGQAIEDRSGLVQIEPRQRGVLPILMPQYITLPPVRCIASNGAGNPVTSHQGRGYTLSPPREKAGVRGDTLVNQYLLDFRK
jgi:hypothetical protein